MPVCLGGWCRRFERKREERRHAQEGERHEIIPREFLFQKEYGKHDENADRDDFLNNFKLEP